MTKTLRVTACAGFFSFLLFGRAEAASPLQITNLQSTANGWLLGWGPSATGTSYTVQFSDTPQDGIWRIPSTFSPLPLSSNRWVDPAKTNAERFYRVVSVPAASRGHVSSVNLSNTYSTFYLSLVFNFAGIPITPQYSVRVYKVDYETITPLGARTMASGVLAVPENVGHALPLVSYQHGTITQTNAAPSSMDLNTELTVGVAFASSGYAAAVPDYLGLGDSPGLHPYHHARSEATACVDLLRAVRTICATNGFPLDAHLFLCGYSQGGHATMALFRELETFHTNEFTVTACAPMAGAYDLSGVTTADFLASRYTPNPYYFLYLLGAYQDVYHLAPNLGSLMIAPYNTNLPPLLNGNSSSSQMNAAMPADPIQILKPDFLTAFRNDPRHPLRLALQENDVYHWRPRARMKMYHCSGDQDVDPANSQVAYTNFLAAGATNVQFLDPSPGTNHSGCVVPSLYDAKQWFDTLR